MKSFPGGYEWGVLGDMLGGPLGHSVQRLVGLGPSDTCWLLAGQRGWAEAQPWGLLGGVCLTLQLPLASRVTSAHLGGPCFVMN